MRIILSFLLFFVCAYAHAQTGSPKTPAQLDSEINSQCPDNNIGLCTPAIYRKHLLDIISSTTGVDIDARTYGANGTATDSVSIQNAINACSAAGGGRVILPALGKAYLINTGLILSDATRSGCSLSGNSGMYWPGPYNNVEANWTQKGTWFHCTDTVNPCITVGGAGNDIENINFWYTQPTPASNSGGPCTSNPCSPLTFGWTPTTYPYTISVLGDTVQFNSGTFNHIRNINIVNATHCLNFEGPTNGQAIFNQYVEHAYMGCFTRGTNFLRLDNTPVFHDVHYHVLWYTFSSDVLGWMQGDGTHVCNRTDWVMGYVAALHANAIEFFESCLAIFAYDETVTNGVGTLTFAVQSGNWTDITFSQVCEALVLQNATTHFDANLANVVLSVDPSTSTTTQCGGKTPVAFGLNSDNVNISIANLDVLDAQTILSLGGGSPGAVPPTATVDLNLVQTYSQYSNGNAAFNIATGACLEVRGLNRLHSINASAGPHFSGVTSGGIAGNCVSSSANMAAIEGAAGTPRQLLFQTSSATALQALGRWGIIANSTAEGGGNSGSDFQVFRYADNGAFLDAPFTINRGNGGVVITNGVTVTLPTSAGGGGLTVCVDTAGVFYKKATCP